MSTHLMQRFMPRKKISLVFKNCMHYAKKKKQHCRYRKKNEKILQYQSGFKPELSLAMHMQAYMHIFSLFHARKKNNNQKKENRLQQLFQFCYLHVQLKDKRFQFPHTYFVDKKKLKKKNYRIETLHINLKKKLG